jgi:hypothetical protein
MAGILSTAQRGTGPMARAMAVAGLAVGALLAVAFLADLLLGIPFGGKAAIMDIGFAICGLILAYLGFDAMRDAR